MIDSRGLFLWMGVVALGSLAACSGKFVNDSSGQAGASSAAGAAGGPFSGASGSYPGPCCNWVPSCDSADQAMYGTTQCPVGASCYKLDGCCGAFTFCAHFDTPPVDAGPPGDGGACTLLGDWDAHSAPRNGESSSASITFKSDGSLSGAPSSLNSGSPFTGFWSLAGSTLTIQNTVGPDMTCAYPDHWTLTFSDDCQTAPLIPIDSGCTGARRYLDWDVTLTRAMVK